MAEGGSGAVGPSDIERRNTPADSLDSATAGKGDSPIFADAKSGTIPPPPSASPPAAWQIGLIVGPSGSGKSTIARRMFGARLYRPRQWADDRAVVDGFGERPIKEITRLLTAVGFCSPPSWIKPYRVLSGGEQFRCDLARALLAGGEGNVGTGGQGNDGVLERWNNGAEIADDSSGGNDPHYSNTPPFHRSIIPPFHHSLAPLVVFDEFTSVVDRNVARVVSAAIAKGIRAGGSAAASWPSLATTT